MNRQELAAYLTDTYGITGKHLFARYPNFLAFRHDGKKKWFAVLMDIPRNNLGLTGDDEISVVNLKCDTRLIGSFREEPGIFSGWHMYNADWLTVELDGTVENEKTVSGVYELRVDNIKGVAVYSATPYLLFIMASYQKSRIS